MSAENYPGLPLPIHVSWHEASVQKMRNLLIMALPTGGSLSYFTRQGRTF